MADGRKAQISERKSPRQARSAGLVATILEAATQVLEAEGAPRFTTARVAERAGVRIGSLYQYFPNKAAIHFRLQSDEWRQTNQLLRGILEDERESPAERLGRLTYEFLRSECEEARMRVALADAAPLYRAAPEAAATRAEGAATLARFLATARPEAPRETRALAAELIGRTLSAVGKDFSETPRSPAEIEAFAGAMAAMFAAYLRTLAHR